MRSSDAVPLSAAGRFGVSEPGSVCRGELSLPDAGEDEADLRPGSCGLDRRRGVSVPGSDRDVLRQLLRHRPPHRHQDLQTGEAALSFKLSFLCVARSFCLSCFLRCR